MVSAPIKVSLVKVAMPPRERLMPELETVLYSGMIAEGEHVYQFEERFADVFGLRNAVATSSGTAALHLALLLADVKPGDEVITTSMTAEPTNTTILQAGAIPVFGDAEVGSGNLDPLDVATLITSSTRALIVVHYAGYPARMREFRRLADEHGVVLIEDCAHALGSRVESAPIGTIGNFAIFSFQAIKHMTTVDGGVITMRDEALIPRARRLRWFGLVKGAARTEVDISECGYKYNMNNVAAVIGKAQLEDIRDRLASHVENGRYFDKELSRIPGLCPASISPGAEPSYWIYTLLSDESDNVLRCLADIGVAASKLHRPNHLHSVFAPYRRPLPGVDVFYRKLVHVPCGWWVTQMDRECIVNALRRG
jgi:perosamine synthetase